VATSDQSRNLSRTLKLYKNKQLEAKFWDVIGLNLGPPENALVLCCDAKPLCQILERTQAACRWRSLTSERGRTTNRAPAAWRHNAKPQPKSPCQYSALTNRSGFARAGLSVQREPILTPLSRDRFVMQLSAKRRR
jgi:hypothetical protein